MYSEGIYFKGLLGFVFRLIHKGVSGAVNYYRWSKSPYGFHHLLKVGYIKLLVRKGQNLHTFPWPQKLYKSPTQLSLRPTNQDSHHASSL